MWEPSPHLSPPLPQSLCLDLKSTAQAEGPAQGLCTAGESEAVQGQGKRG